VKRAKAGKKEKGKPAAKPLEGVRSEPSALRERPLVSFACVCERPLQDKDGVISLIRIVDTFFLDKFPAVAARPSDFPATIELTVATIELTVAIGLKAGRVRGRHEVGLATYRPSGERSEFPERWPIVFDEDYSSANFLIKLFVNRVEPGSYRAEVLFDGDALTDITFRVLTPETKNENEV
jgi:hypothetical protein